MEGQVDTIIAVEAAAAGLTVGSVILYGENRVNTRRIGAILGIIGNVLWMGWGYYLGPAAFLIALNAALLAVNVRNMWRM
jgi:hypothetical protein